MNLKKTALFLFFFMPDLVAQLICLINCESVRAWTYLIRIVFLGSRRIPFPVSVTASFVPSSILYFLGVFKAMLLLLNAYYF